MPEVIAETLVAVRADTSHLDTDIRRGVDEAVNKAERGSKRFGGVATQLRELRGASLGAGSAIDVVDGAIGGSIGTMALAGAAVGGVVLGLGKAVDAYVELTDSVRQFAQRSGASADESSRFVAVTDDYGISAETAANSLFFLGRAVETNSEGLTRLGVNVERTSSGQLDLAATVQSVADAYARTNDPGKRAELVMAALGRQGRELIPILEKGGEGLRELFADVPGGQIMSDRDLQQALDFKLAMDDAHDAVMELEVALAEGVVPALAAAARASSPLIRGVGFIAENLVTGIRGVVEALRNPTELANYDKFVAKVLATGDAVSDLTDVELDSADAADIVAQARATIIDATLRDEAATRSLEDARQKVTEAEADYQDALRGTGRYAEAAADAADRLRSSQENLVRAQRRVRDITLDVGEAQEELAAAQIRFGTGSKEARDAARDLQGKQDDLADAHDGVKDAADAVLEAERKLAEVRDLSDERREAAEKLADARFNLTQKTADAATASANLKSVQAGLHGELVTGTEKADLLRAALERLAAPLPTGAEDSVTRLLGLLSPSRALQPGEPGYIPPLRPGEFGPAAPGQGRLAGPPVPSTSAGPAIGEVNIYYPIDLNQLLEQAEYAAGIGD